MIRHVRMCLFRFAKWLIDNHKHDYVSTKMHPSTTNIFVSTIMFRITFIQMICTLKEKSFWIFSYFYLWISLFLCSLFPSLIVSINHRWDMKTCLWKFHDFSPITIVSTMSQSIFSRFSTDQKSHWKRHSTEECHAVPYLFLARIYNCRTW